MNPKHKNQTKISYCKKNVREGRTRGGGGGQKRRKNKRERGKGIGGWGNGERDMRKEWSGVREGNTHSNYSSEIPFPPEERVKILRLVKSQ